MEVSSEKIGGVICPPPQKKGRMFNDRVTGKNFRTPLCKDCCWSVWSGRRDQWEGGSGWIWHGELQLPRSVFVSLHLVCDAWDACQSSGFFRGTGSSGSTGRSSCCCFPAFLLSLRLLFCYQSCCGCKRCCQLCCGCGCWYYMLLLDIVFYSYYCWCFLTTVVGLLFVGLVLQQQQWNNPHPRIVTCMKMALLLWNVLLGTSNGRNLEFLGFVACFQSGNI